MDLRWLQLAIGYGALGSEALVDPRTVRRLACDAEIVPMVLGSRSEPLDVGRLQRTVTDAIRRALNLRDGGCAFPELLTAARGVATPTTSVTGSTVVRPAWTTWCCSAGSTTS